MQPYLVKKKTTLLEYLLETLQGIKKSKAKNYLKFRSVFVNGKSVTQFDYPLSPGDEVMLRTDKAEAQTAYLKSRLDIIYEDTAILVINKPAGLLTIATETIQTQTAYYQVHEYLNHSEPAKKKPVFIVHRLDRDASGLLIFAKSPEAKHYLQSEWPNFEKHYYAVVHGTPAKSADTIESYLAENKFLNVYSIQKQITNSKHAVTHYKVLKSNGIFSLLEVTIETGRKHQIRVHMSDMNHPIIGDERYAYKTEAQNPSPAGRMGLHACYLAINHPATGKRVIFRSDLPHILSKIFS